MALVGGRDRDDHAGADGLFAVRDRLAEPAGDVASDLDRMMGLAYRNLLWRGGVL